jgi:hypothetical protein
MADDPAVEAAARMMALISQGPTADWKEWIEDAEAVVAAVRPVIEGPLLVQISELQLRIKETLREGKDG